MDWEKIFWRTMPRIYNFFRYRYGDNDLAEELTSHTFERAWRFRHQFNGQLFEAWLFTIARNISHDHLRTRPDNTISFESIPDYPSDDSVEQEVWIREQKRQVREFLAQLPAREQELIALKYGGGLTNRAIADIMNLSESNVGTLLHRAIQKLRMEFEHE